MYAVTGSVEGRKRILQSTACPWFAYLPKLHPERKMSKYQPFKKVDRRCLNFLKEEKIKKKYNFNYLALNRSSIREARAFLYQKGLKNLLHASKVMILQPVEVRV